MAIEGAILSCRVAVASAVEVLWGSNSAPHGRCMRATVAMAAGSGARAIEGIGGFSEGSQMRIEP